MEIKNITVLGSGIMGHGIAQVSAMAGYNVILRDIEQKFLDKAMDKIKWSLDKLVSINKLLQKTEMVLRSNDGNYLMVIQRFMLNFAKILK